METIHQLNKLLVLMKNMKNKPLPAKASQPAAPYTANVCAINSNAINSTGLSYCQPAQPAERPVTAAKLLAYMQVIC